MQEDQIVNPGESGQVVLPPAVEPPVTPPAVDKTDWQAKYTGLQGYAKTQRAQAEEWQRKHNDVMTQAEAERVETTRKLEQLQRERDALNTDLEQAKKQIAEFTERSVISKVVREKYPALTDLFEDGLIRTQGLQGEELEKHLEALNAKLQGTIGRTVTETLRGTTPPTPRGQRGTLTVDEIQDQLFRAQYGTPEYNVLLQQYNEALRLESNK